MALALDLKGAKTAMPTREEAEAVPAKAKKQQSATAMVINTILMSVVFVTGLTAALVALTPADPDEVLGFALMIGFWIGIGAGIIVAGVRFGLRWEALNHPDD